MHYENIEVAPKVLKNALNTTMIIISQNLDRQLDLLQLMLTLPFDSYLLYHNAFSPSARQPLQSTPFVVIEYLYSLKLSVPLLYSDWGLFGGKTSGSPFVQR